MEGHAGRHAVEGRVRVEGLPALGPEDVGVLIEQLGCRLLEVLLGTVIRRDRTKELGPQLPLQRLGRNASLASRWSS